MDNQLLKYANKMIRNRRPYIDETQACVAIPVGSMLDIYFVSRQCRNDKDGKCIMCDYGYSGNNWSEDDYIKSLKNILNNDLRSFKSILISANGSMMDEYQISKSLFQRIIIELSFCTIPEIGIETHYQTVTEDKLYFIQQKLFDKKIFIEMGLETLNTQCLSNIIMKSMNLEDISNTINMIHLFNFDVVLNILFGMPFMNSKEQMKDAEISLHWILKQQCRAVIFPINIKPFTLLSHIYQTGFYQPVSHWLLILMLNDLPAVYLSSITIAYYGNRDDDYQNVNKYTIYPTYCEICKSKLFIFYHSFNIGLTSEKRKLLLTNLLNETSCDCLVKQKSEINECHDNTSFTENYLIYEDFLRSEISRGEFPNE